MTDPKDLLSRDEVKATAELAALDLTEAGLERMTGALQAMLGHFAVIGQVELPGKIAGSPVERPVPFEDMRADEAVQADNEQVLASAPDFEDELFFVPRILA